MNLLGLLSWHVYPKIHLGPLSVSPHGLGIAVGYAAGGQLMARYAKRKGIDPDDVWAMLMRAVFGVIVGARLFYVVGHIPDYWPNVLDIFKVWEGGLVFYGGVFGGIAAGYPYARKKGLKFWRVLDSAAPGFPLGLIFGRIGDLVVGDHLGGPTTLPWAFRAARGATPVSVPLSEACRSFAPQLLGNPNIGCHQTALYDFVNVLILFPLVLWFIRKPRADGVPIMFTALLYGVGRFFVDFARSGTATYLGLRGTQYISLFLVVLGIWYTVRLARRGPTPAEEETVPEGVPFIPADEIPAQELPHPLGEDTAPKPQEFLEHPLAHEAPPFDPPERPLG